MLALKTLFDPSAATGLSATYELRLGEHTFRAHVDDGRFDLTRATPQRPDATIDTDAGTLSAVLWHGRALADALRAGAMRIDGSRSAVTRFLRLFPAPLPAPASGAP
jgi:alkyl sulfatase BDS1-like metallo-beta-lactamase superfamily hydrolase